MSGPLEATQRVLDQAGIAYVVERAKRHFKVRFTIRGEACLLIVSGTSSDHRAAKNARQLALRTIRRALNRH